MIPNEEVGQFKPGQSGNLAGRPKKLPGLDKLLAEVLGEDLAEAKAIVQALVDRAKKGHVRSAQLILDRAFGKEVIPVNLAVSTFDIAKIDLTKLSPAALDEILNLYSEND